MLCNVLGSVCFFPVDLKFMVMRVPQNRLSLEHDRLGMNIIGKASSVGQCQRLNMKTEMLLIFYCKAKALHRNITMGLSSSFMVLAHKFIFLWGCTIWPDTARATGLDIPAGISP